MTLIPVHLDNYNLLFNGNTAKIDSRIRVSEGDPVLVQEFDYATQNLTGQSFQATVDYVIPSKFRGSIIGWNIRVI